jgi:hypothetical protein
MHAPKAVSVAVTLALLATGLVALGAPAVAAPVSHLAPHPSATDSISATNQYGSVRSDFYVGYNSGVVYFSATDPSDSQATVTLVDTNATRDNVSTPAFTATASFATSIFNDSWQNGVGYLLPLTLRYGGNWTLSISGASGGVYNTTIYVHTYDASVSTTKYAYLPGHAGQGLFQVSATANDAPYTLASVKILSQYYTTSATWATLPGSPFTFSGVARGNFSFTVPLTASVTGTIEFLIFANTTTGNSEVGYNSASVGNMSAPIVQLGSCPGGCFTSGFHDGATAYVAIQEMIEGAYTTAPAAGINLAVSFASASLPATPPGVPTTLVTNATGGAAFVFIASSSVFSTTQANELTITASDPQNPSLPTASTHVLFAVSKTGTVTPQVQVSFDSLQYYSGDTATVTWELGGLNASATAGWTADQWQVVDDVGGALLGWGTINSTGTQGQFRFAIPSNYGGEITAYVSAYNVSDWTEGWTTYSAHVTAPSILLNPSEAYYLPGDTVSVQVTTEGSVFSSTTLYESVVESNGYQLSSGVLSGTQIQIPIPMIGAPSYVTVSVAAQSPTLGIVSTNSIDLEEGSGYVLYAGISSASNYADGSYQPGQTVTLSYSLTAVGTASLPKTFDIYVYPGSVALFGSGYGSVAQQATSPSGSVSYTLPSNVPAGAQTFTVVVTSGICGYSCGAADQFSALVEPNPSALGYELGAGSGVTVGWVILLVLILLVFLAAFVWMRRGGRSGGKPSAVKPFSPSGSSTGESKTSSSSTWKEESPPSTSGSDSASPPPMPGKPPA